jgi:hypothetical protein
METVTLASDVGERNQTKQQGQSFCGPLKAPPHPVGSSLLHYHTMQLLWPTDPSENVLKASNFRKHRNRVLGIGTPGWPCGQEGVLRMRKTGLTLTGSWEGLNSKGIRRPCGQRGLAFKAPFFLFLSLPLYCAAQAGLELATLLT